MDDMDKLREQLSNLLEALDGADFEKVADAVIADLGLTVETASVYRDGGPPLTHRVVGKWEEEGEGDG